MRRRARPGAGPTVWRKLGRPRLLAGRSRAATDCFSCHDFGGDPGIKPWACARCHVDPAGPAIAHFDQDCASCHRPHQQPSLLPRSCQDCHAADEIGTIQHGRRVVAGATTCLDCHEAHDQSIDASARCQRCHDRERPIVPATALRGGHDTCQTCQADGCATCHRAHGPGGVATPPACLDCHHRRALPNLHQGKGHEKCADCHGAHLAEPGRDRASCLRCHTDMRDHEPGAAFCSGCHPFSGRGRPVRPGGVTP